MLYANCLLPKHASEKLLNTLFLQLSYQLKIFLMSFDRKMKRDLSAAHFAVADR